VEQPEGKKAGPPSHHDTSPPVIGCWERFLTLRVVGVHRPGFTRLAELGLAEQQQLRDAVATLEPAFGARGQTSGWEQVVPAQHTQPRRSSTLAEIGLLRLCPSIRPAPVCSS